MRPITRLDGVKQPNLQGLYTAKNGQKIQQQDLNLAKSLKARVKSRYQDASKFHSKKLLQQDPSLKSLIVTDDKPTVWDENDGSRSQKESITGHQNTMAAQTFNAKNNKVFGAKNKNAKFAFQVSKMRTRTSMENYRQKSQAKNN